MAQLAMFQGEQTVEELAARVFKVSGSDPQAAKQATAALLKANPQLANLAQVPAGTVIVVPDTGVAVNGGQTVRPTTLLSADPTATVTAHVSAFGASLATASMAAATQANSTVALATDPNLKAAVANNAALTQRLATLTQSTNAALADLQAKRTLLQQALAQMQQDLASFLKPPTPPPGSGGSPTRTPVTPAPGGPSPASPVSPGSPASGSPSPASPASPTPSPTRNTPT
jgi:hypothetical protein